MKRRSVCVLLCACILLLSGCAPKQNAYKASFMELFDTVSFISGYAVDEESFTKASQDIHDRLAEYHRLYDIYNDYDGIVNIKTINDHAGETVKVDRKIIDFLLFAQKACEMTGGKVDITLGSVLSLWHDARTAGLNDPENAALPEEALLKEAALHTGFDKLVIDEENCTVCLTDPQMKLDVGAIAKGYAVQQVCSSVKGSYLVSVGGNVVVTGSKPDGANWIIGIQDPRQANGVYHHKLKVTGGAVVTSGDYQRSYVVDGEQYPHIIDPETLYPGKRWASVSIICSDSGLADVLSTALYLMDLEEGQQLLASVNAEAVWIDGEGNVVYSEGYRNYIQD